RTQHHGVAVARAGVSGGTREVSTAVSTRGENRLVGAETMQRAVRHVQSHDTAAFAVLHDKVDGEVLDEELCVVTQRLLVQRVQHCVTCSIRGRAGTLRRALPVVRRHAAEGTLIYTAVFRA